MTETKPRLLVVTSMFPRWPDDVEPGFVFELCRRLSAQFDVRVLAPHAPGAATREVMDGVDVIRYRYAPERLETLAYGGGIVPKLRRQPWKWLLVPLMLAGQYVAIRRELRRWRPEVVHAHWIIPQGVLAAFAIGRRRPPALIVTSHGADLFAFKGRTASRLKRFALTRAADVTVVSRVMRDIVLTLGVEDAKIRVASMGVDLMDRFTPDPATPRSRHEILFVGRLVAKKGVHHLLDAAPAIFARVPEARIRIIGFGPDEAALRAQALALNLDDRVEFAGPMPQAQLPELYRRAAVFAAPFVEDASGDQEGLGLVVVEATGCGCPVVASALPALLDVFGDEAADLVEPGNPQQLADAIIRVLLDPAGEQARAEALRETLLRHFDWSAVAERYATLIENRMNAARKGSFRS